MFGHFHLSVDNLFMTPQAVYLFLRHMLFVDERYVAILFRPLHMAEIAFVFGNHSVTPGNFGVALTADVACLDGFIMGEAPAFYHNILRGCRMAGRAARDCLSMRRPLEMAKETYIHGYLEVLPLNNIRMAASAMELYAAFHF